VAASVVTAAVTLNAGAGASPKSHASTRANSGLDIYFIAGATSDPFMSVIKHGADAAAKALEANGGSLHWLPLQNYNNIGPDLAQLMRTASSQHPAAVIAPDWVPTAENAALKNIASGGTPVILWNQGTGSSGTSVNDVGALYYIGATATGSGKEAGKYMVQHGVKHVLCVNTVPGSSIQEQRCNGLKLGMQTGGGSETELKLPSTNYGNPTTVAQAIKAALLHDHSIDGVMSVNLSDQPTAVSALRQANLQGKVKLATFDLNSSVLQEIQSGVEMLAIDQNGYMQGYLAVSLAYQYVKFGMKLPQASLITGPNLITKANVAAAIQGAKYGVR
jgi:simple sugar transport system substrate-binding protein